MYHKSSSFSSFLLLSHSELHAMTRGDKSRPEMGREVAISKALSLLLRHAAEKDGVKINAQGYVNVADVV